LSTVRDDIEAFVERLKTDAFARSRNMEEIMMNRYDEQLTQLSQDLGQLRDSSDAQKQSLSEELSTLAHQQSSGLDALSADIGHVGTRVSEFERDVGLRFNEV
jgi:chromosome segregation ATPase